MPIADFLARLALRVRAYLASIIEVFFPGTRVPKIAKVLLKPDLEVEGMHVVARLLQQRQRQATVHAATQQYRNTQTATAWFTAAQNPQLSDSGGSANLRNATAAGL